MIPWYFESGDPLWSVQIHIDGRFGDEGERFKKVPEMKKEVSASVLPLSVKFCCRSTDQKFDVNVYGRSLRETSEFKH